jgi:hypothetical protein
LVHHFFLPEVEKQLIRKKIQKRQKEKLRTVHDAVYSEIEEVTPNRKLDAPSSSKHRSGSKAKYSKTDDEVQTQ